MLQIRNLSMVHTKDLHPIVEHFTYSLNPGDKAVLIGGRKWKIDAFAADL